MNNSISIATDIFTDKGNPSDSLRKIKDAGFTHIHFGHQIVSDYIFTDDEIDYLKKIITNTGLISNDIHGSPGRERCWYSPDDYLRIAGRELIKNRIKTASILGADAVVLHPFEEENKDFLDIKRKYGEKTLMELKDYSESLGIKIAFENLYTSENNFETIDYFFDRFGPEYIGFCWDTGHSNIPPHDGLDWCRKFIKRLEVIHLADNHGKSDEHQPVYTGTVDWNNAVEWISKSGYRKPVTVEVEYKGGYESEEAFLKKSYDTGIVFRDRLLREIKRKQ